MSNYSRLSEIKAKPIPRANTDFDELDFIYGYSDFPGIRYWGMPLGKISLWAGTSGIGKSRLAIEVAKNISLRGKILYFQTESSLEDFAGWAKDTKKYQNFYCSGENRLDEIIAIIKEVGPQLVIIDSVNEIEEFAIGTKKEARRLINGEGDNIGLKQIASELELHIILLGQLNGDGSIKGGTSLPHLVDIALNLKPYTDECKSTFTVSVGIKHRCGRRDDHIYGVWYHVEEGVRCASNNRFIDDKWCEGKGITVKTRAEQLTGSTVESETEIEEYAPVKKMSFLKQLLGF